MKPARFAIIAAATLLGALAGCKDVTGSEESLYLSYIQGLDTDNPQVVVPTNATAGQAFEVSVNTVWQNGCMRKGELDISQEPQWVLITPYDIMGEINSGCATGSKQFVHTGSVTFNTAGTYTVYIRGRNSANEEVVTIEREVIVE